MGQPDGPVEFAGKRMRPDLAAETVELELTAEALERGARHHAEHGPKAACGCPARVDGTDPYLHRAGCPRQGTIDMERFLLEMRDSAGLRSDEVRCKLCSHGSDSHRYGDPVVCAECPERVCRP